MSVSMIDNISYKGKKSDNIRSQFSTLAEMVAYSENYLPDMYDSFCLETRKKYRYDVNNTEDAKLGKWREIEEGGITEIPTASKTIKGGIKLGDRLSINNEVLSADVQSNENFTEDLKDKLESIDMDTKVDKVSGKGLSTNDLTDELKTQYDKAQKNVQSDWEETDSSKDEYIKNKPQKLSSFENDENFISNLVEDLKNYYLKSETYTRTEIDALINAVNQFGVKIVSELPTENINTHIFYLLPKEGSEDDIYTEYIYVNNEWEKIGTTEVKLTIDSELSESSENAVQNKVITQELNNKVNKENGKGLSSNDFTDALKTKLEDSEAARIISLTQEEYDALTEIDPDVYYDITDEEELVFLNDGYIEDTEEAKTVVSSSYKTNPGKVLTIYVDYENGDDSNDGLTSETPVKHMTNDFISNKFGTVKYTTFILMSDYDIEGITLQFCGNTLALTSFDTTSPQKIYSSVACTSSMLSFAYSTKVNITYLDIEQPAGSTGSYIISCSSGNLYVAYSTLTSKCTSTKPYALIEITRGFLYCNNDTFDTGSVTNCAVVGSGDGITLFAGCKSNITIPYLIYNRGNIVQIYNCPNLLYNALSRNSGTVLIDIDKTGAKVNRDCLDLPLPECDETTEGTYVLKCTVTDGVPVYSWVAE